MSRNQLQKQDLFLRGKNSNLIENTTLSNQVPETIKFTDVPLQLFREKVSHGSYFSLNLFRSTWSSPVI